MTYTIEYEVTGRAFVTIDADSIDEALEKAVTSPFDSQPEIVECHQTSIEDEDGNREYLDDTRRDYHE